MKKLAFIFYVHALLLTARLLALEPILVVYGPPGSGKGTFSQHIKEHYGYEHVSTGDLLRAEIDKGTSIGHEIEQTVKRGDFVRQEIVYDLTRKKVMDFVNTNSPFIIDGFAMSEESLLFLDNLFRELNLYEKVLLIYLDAGDEACAERTLSRLVCPRCTQVYNMLTNPPLREEVCNRCDTALKIRVNDTREIVEKRLKTYRNLMEKIVGSAKETFPYIIFDTQHPLKECLQNYDRFMEISLQFHGTVRQLWHALSLERVSTQ